MKRSRLNRKSPLRAKRKAPAHVDPTAQWNEPGRCEFKRPYWDFCAGCGKYGLCRRHHVVREQHLRVKKSNPWDLRNGVSIGIEGKTCDCHEQHHNASHRLPVRCIPDDALRFVFDLYGEYGLDYIRREYRDDGDARLVAMWGLQAWKR